jgi:hypothetical protein
VWQARKKRRKLHETYDQRYAHRERQRHAEREKERERNKRYLVGSRNLEREVASELRGAIDDDDDDDGEEKTQKMEMEMEM